MCIRNLEQVLKFSLLSMKLHKETHNYAMLSAAMQVNLSSTFATEVS